MPHNLTVTYGRASISINSTHQVGLRVQTTTADHQGRRTQDFILEISTPSANAHAHALSVPGHLHPDEHLPMASLAREPRDGRIRGTPQPPPDGYAAAQHEATDYVSYDRSRQSTSFEEPYYQPHERAPTSSRTSTSTGAGYEYAIPAHEPTHGMGGERVQYHGTRDPESGRIERRSASSSPLHSHRHPNPSISITPPTPRHRNPTTYRGSELVPYNHDAPGGSPCESYYYHGDDGGGGVSEASYQYSDAEDGGEWEGGGGERVGLGGEDGYRRYH